jgi:ribokinase
MAAPKIVVVGSSNMDIYSWTHHLPEPGETVIGDRYWMVMGGKGANQAVAASQLGAEVAMVGRVGDDLFGRQMIETLASYKVSSDFIQVDRHAGSGVALVVVDKKPENIIVVIPGANMRISQEDVDAAAEKLRNSQVLMMQLEIPLEAIERAMETARKGEAYIILNPAPARPLPSRLLSMAHLITPNQNEAKVLSGIPADTMPGAENAGRRLLEMGAHAVIITLGPDGALVFRDKEAKSVHVPGVPMKDAIDTTGAGDAFMGGLSVAIAEGKNLEQAASHANFVAALSTRRLGAMPSMPSREEVEELILQREALSNVLEQGIWDVS